MKRAIWACCASLVAALSLWLWPGTVHANRVVLTLDKAEWLDHSGIGLPKPQAQGLLQDLPHDWRRWTPPSDAAVATNPSGWYRLRFDWPAASTQPQALLVPRVGVVAEFWLNAERLSAQEPEFGETPTRMWNRPHIFHVRPGLLTAHDNELLVRLQGHSHLVSGLSAMQIGSFAELVPTYHWRWAAQVAAPWALAGVCILMGFAALALFARTRRSELLPFFVLGLFQAPRTILPVLETPPFSVMGGTWLTGFTHICFGAAFYWLLRPFARSWIARWNQFTAGFVVLVLLSWSGLGLTGLASQRAMALHMIPLLVCALIAVAALVRHLWLLKSWGSLTVCAAAFAVNGLGWGHDALHRLGHVPFDHFSVGPLTAIPGYFCMLWIAAQRYVSDERATALARLEAATQARQQERERLLADVHDGLGAQIIASISRAKRGALSGSQTTQELYAVLDELRLVIDSRQSNDLNLATSLSMLCERFQPRLQEVNCRLRWQAEEPAASALSARQRLSLLRIVQTALANVLQHAKASECGVSLTGVATAWQLEVRDDGCGFDASQTTPRGHYGLQNMQRRAQELGASICIDSAPGGTRVLIQVRI